MSIRPSVYPVSDIEPIRQALGSGDASLVERIREAYLQRERALYRDDFDEEELPKDESDDEDSDDVEEFELDEEELEEITELAQAFIKGELEDGKEPGVWTEVNVLLAHALDLMESKVPVNDDWKWIAWRDYFDYVSPWLAEQPRELLRHLAAGRPLRARAIDEDGCFFAWLTRDEVINLLAALRNMAEEHPEVASEDFIDGFHEELIEWLGECEGRCLLLDA